MLRTDHLSCILVFANAHVAHASQMVADRPLLVSASHNDFRLHPHAAQHLLGREALTPSAWRSLGKIREGASFGNERFQSRIELAPRRGNKAGPNTCAEP